MDPLERHISILSAAAEHVTHVRALQTYAKELMALEELALSLDEKGLREQATQLRSAMNSATPMQALPPPPRPRGRPRKEDGGEA